MAFLRAIQPTADAHRNSFLILFGKSLEGEHIYREAIVQNLSRELRGIIREMTETEGQERQEAGLPQPAKRKGCLICPRGRDPK